MFHVIALTGDWEGPSVVLFGGEQEGTFVGVYQTETEHDIIDIPNSKVEIQGEKLKTVQMPSIFRRRSER